MIFNRVLSEQEIEELYQYGLNGHGYPIDLIEAIDHIETALAEKLEALGKIESALQDEYAALDALEALLESGDYEGLKKADIIKARQRVHQAIQHQQQCLDDLEQSIVSLEGALAALSLEAE